MQLYGVEVVVNTVENEDMPFQEGRCQASRGHWSCSDCGAPRAGCIIIGEKLEVAVSANCVSPNECGLRMAIKALEMSSDIPRIEFHRGS